MSSKFRSTTILAVRKGDQTAIAGDGQVSLGNTSIKHQSCKIRSLRNKEVLLGFAGSAADAFALMERFESKLDQYKGNVPKASIELAKEWRTDRYLRKLEALMIVASKKHLLLISGTGDVIEPDDCILGIGSGGAYAIAAAKALYVHSKLNAKEIAEEALKIAAGICVFTNDHITTEVIE